MKNEPCKGEVLRSPQMKILGRSGMLKFVVSVMAFAYACIISVYAGDEYIEAKSKALAHYIMAGIYDYNGQAVEAITEYERSSNLDHQQILPHMHLASYYARAGLLEKA